ncbi:MAG: sulfatase [Planctomycetota bacterium]
MKLFRPALALSSLALLLGCPGKTAPSEPRNVLLITLDTTRADYLSVNGFHRETSPKLDELAASGVNFSRAMSSSAVTPVSHATILTGRFPDKHGLRVLAARGGFRLPEDVPTLAQILKDRGYRTGAIHSAFPVSKVFGFARDYDYFDSVEATFLRQQKRDEESGELVEDESSQRVGWDVKNFQRRSDATTDKALAWLEGRKTDEAPWFLWLHYWDPHDPKKTPPRDFLDREAITMTRKGRYTSGYDEFYAEEIRYMDSQIGRVLDALRESGDYSETVTVLTADHGEGLYDGEDDHGWPAHRELYRQQINVPLILHLPDREEDAGKQFQDLVRTADVFPTVLDSLGFRIPEEVDGASLIPLLEGRSGGSRLHYAEQINGYDFNASMIDKRPIADFIYSVMDDDWKLIYRPNHPEASELFQHSIDPGEKNNLWESEPEQRLRLLKELAKRESWVTTFFPHIELTAEETEGVEAALSGLGYIGTEPEDGEVKTFDDEPEYDWAWTCPGEEEVVFDEPGWCETADCPRILVRKPER